MIGSPAGTRLVHNGSSSMIEGRGLERLTLRNLVLDGEGQSVADPYSGLLSLFDAKQVNVRECAFVNSGQAGLSLQRSAGQVMHCRFDNAVGLAGFYTNDGAGVSIAHCTLRDCGNGGILVHRSEPGDDGTIVSGNRIERIRADDGGTGQRGNGVNMFRAHGVQVTGNHISDCAFSAIRGNGASNAVVSANTLVMAAAAAAAAAVVVPSHKS